MQGDGDGGSLAWQQRLRRVGGFEIRRQVHQSWFHRLQTVVQDVDLLHGGVALIHIVKLEDILVEQQVTHCQRISARVVEQFGQNHTLHREIDRLRGAIACDGGHLLEVAKLTGVVGHRDGELVIGPHLSRVLHSSTATVGFDALDDEFAMAFIPQLECSGNGLLIACTTTLNGGLCDNNFLRLGRCQA